MFRSGAASSPYDEAIAKATDENLTSEDWGAILEVCDKVTSDANGPNQAVQALIKRLAHRNANVQLYTLELANSLSQNCGKNMHRELASRSFTDALLKLANDRNTHQQVKSKILERMKEWADMFKSDPDLGIMYDAYYRLKQTNPTLQAPSAPQKTGLTELDRQKEEDELQIALKLSLQEEERKKSSAPGPSSAAGPSAAGAPAAQAAEPAPSHPTGTTAATVSRVRALYDFVPSEPGELEFKKGDVIAVLESVYKDWWRGSLKGKTGIFPLNYVEKLTDPTPDELQREAQMEAEVFAEIKNVEKLLTLLSTLNSAPREEDNEEISKLYHQTLAIRPKLIKLIEKYSQKKDDFTQLNEKFIKARRDYESLLEASMSHPPQPTYHQYAPRPPMPQGYGVPGGTPGPGYAPQGPPPVQVQQDPQRYYTPGPQGPPQEQIQYQATSPPPNFQRQTPGPAPFYLRAPEGPAQAGAPPPQQYPPQAGPPPAQQQPPYAPQGASAPPPQQYTPLVEPPSSVAAGKQPATTSSPPPQQQPQQPQYQGYSTGRPQSTYNGAQELAVDSPAAAYHASAPSAPGAGPAEPWSASVYSPQEDPYAVSSPSAAPSAPSAPPSGPPSMQQGVPTPLAVGAPPFPQHQQQPQQFGPYNPQRQDSYDAPIPPQPTGSAPPPPEAALTPPPLRPGGVHYDARQSQVFGPPQFKAYVPGGAAGGEPSAPPAQPQDYYRPSAAY
ncbi:hypothetical protein F4780DRAFT_793638 [Xylariomycetidae sp. FL0641]|nr:hypothetical protein F4780DRAFT_793638 [Xylariomycetidae sp. FL0641]